jgi:hypothetical protein
MNDQPLRLGFPVKVMGKPGLKSNDTRRWQKNPHLKTSLEYVSEILDYLARHKIGMYRLSSDLAPYATHPDMPQFHAMVAESDAELGRELCGRVGDDGGMRAAYRGGCPSLPEPLIESDTPWKALPTSSGCVSLT